MFRPTHALLSSLLLLGSCTHLPASSAAGATTTATTATRDTTVIEARAMPKADDGSTMANTEGASALSSSSEAGHVLASTERASSVDTSDMDASDNAPKPGILDALPARFATFDYEGHRWFGDESGGFTLRYGNRRKHRLAEVYVYPVAEQNAKLDHQSLVLGSTRASIEAISQAAGSGHYANFNLVNAAMRSHGVRTEARVQATYLQQNLATYTLVYQTEHEGTLLKVRVTMPDNDANRDNDEWDAFASYMFDRIIGELDADETIVSWLDE